MKYSRFRLLLGGKKDFCFWFLTLIAGSLFFYSCEDDQDRPSASAHISFVPMISDSWNLVTRSGMIADAPRDSVTLFLGCGDTPFYLHTHYADSISSPFSDSRADTAALTRATPVTRQNMYTRFGVSAYSYTGSWNESRTPDYMYDATASNSGGTYTLSPAHYWPGASYKMRFFAYAPQGHGQYVLSGRTDAGSPTLRVSVPSGVADQKDLLVVKTDELVGNNNRAVALAFKHALTAVKFVCGSDMRNGTVKSVKLKNVYSKGIYHMGTESWSSQSAPASFSQELNKKTSGTSNEALTSEAQTFMMVPQTLPEGARLEVVFNDGLTEHTLTANIGGTRWPMGKTVLYKISTSSINWTYILRIVAPSNFNCLGGTDSFRVISYKQNTKGARQAVAWTTRYSTDNGATWTSSKPSWLTTFTSSGDGGMTEKSYNAIVAIQDGVSSSAHTEALRRAVPKGSESSPYNLSDENGASTVKNTANCYVINAPGVYSFPLVYGNAIKNGRTNTSAYAPSVRPAPKILRPFINHAGVGITDPYIVNNRCAPAKAELVWQDAPQLVSGIAYTPGKNGGFISFKVNQATIQQGNAVIAVKDASDAILWSWHIWVTDENLNNTIGVTNQKKKTYQLMPVNLGWCDENTTTYAERHCKVRFIAGGKTEEITIRQAANQIVTGGNNPYYQWGRKDPFLPSNGINNSTKIWYKANGAFSFANPLAKDLGTGTSGIRNYILQPDVMQYNLTGDNLYFNLWSANNSLNTVNDNKVVKTIYDPCPVGFMLPAGNAFTGFLKEEKIALSVELNGVWDSARKGEDFYSSPNKNGKRIFFPASGYRSSTGPVYVVGTQGFYWLALPGDQRSGYRLFFYQRSGKDLGTLNGVSRTLGLSLRPSRE